jgi:LysM repeat protein
MAIGGSSLLIAMLVYRGIAAAVSEQAIGGAVPRRAVAAPAQPEPSEPAAPSSQNDVPTPPPPPINPTRTFQAHATFPYTIRAGDTLGSIAAQFGIPLAELARANRVKEDTELEIGKLLRIPNPAVAHERELTTQIDQLDRDKQMALDRAVAAESRLSSARASLQAATAERRALEHDARSLGWFRAVTYVLTGATFLMLGAMLLALADWWILRNRFRAVVEMNEGLRRLDYKYKTALAKAELRLQELYGRRRRGIHDGQDRPKLPEEAEIESLTRELKAVLEHHLKRIGPGNGAGAQRAQWRERIARIGSPGEPRPVRR